MCVLLYVSLFPIVTFIAYKLFCILLFSSKLKS